MKEKKPEQIPFNPTPFEDALYEIAPDIVIPEYFWDFPYEIQKTIVENMARKKEAGMKPEKILDHFNDLVEEWFQESTDSKLTKN